MFKKYFGGGMTSRYADGGEVKDRQAKGEYDSGEEEYKNRLDDYKMKKNQTKGISDEGQSKNRRSLR
jgi:hypothetical protein